jgi:hypothetical protein
MLLKLGFNLLPWRIFSTAFFLFMQTRTSFAITVLTVLLCVGCADHKLPAPINCTDEPVVLELISVVDSDCALQNGSIEVTASGGSGSYLFRLNGGEPQTASVFLDVGAGVYEISATDDNNCTGTQQATVQNKDGLNVTFQSTDTGCKGSNGVVTIAAFDGVEPYQYKIDGSSYSTNNIFTDLAAGNHTIFVKDETGCELTQTIKLRSGISYSTSIDPIISTNCAITGCHNGTQFPDFRNFENIQKNAAQIKTLTGNRTMPEDGSLTQAEIDMIACWVDDGAVAN